MAVSGGSTPRIMFQAMSARQFDWTAIDIYQVDERCVPPDHEQSNYRMIRAALSGPAEIHRMRGELEPAVAAAECERQAF